MLQRILFLFVLLAGAPALAQRFDGPHNDIDAMSASYLPRITYASGNAFTAVQMNATRTIDKIRTWGWRYLQLSFKFVYSTADRAVTCYCEGSPDGNDWYRLQNLSPVTTTITSYDQIYTKTPTASANWTWTFNINGYEWMRCATAVTGGTTLNLLTVTGKLLE